MFGVLFIRGSVKINLQRFFRVTTVILYFVTFQLVVSGLHELSENGVLPSSQTEMRLIGPIVRNDLFFFVTMLALAGLMMLLEYRRRAPVVLAATATDADRRRALWSQRREKMWMNAVVGTSFVFIFLSTAEFIYAKSSTALSPTASVTLVGEQVTIPASEINDDKLHRFGVQVDDGKGWGWFRTTNRGQIPAVQEARWEHRFGGRRLLDLRAGGVLYRKPGDYVQDVRFALECGFDGAGGWV